MAWLKDSIFSWASYLGGYALGNQLEQNETKASLLFAPFPRQTEFWLHKEEKERQEKRFMEKRVSSPSQAPNLEGNMKMLSSILNTVNETRLNSSEKAFSLNRNLSAVLNLPLRALTKENLQRFRHILKHRQKIVHLDIGDNSLLHPLQFYRLLEICPNLDTVNLSIPNSQKIGRAHV